MTKLRGVACALFLVSVLAALVPILGLAGPTEIAVSGEPIAAESSPVAVEEEAAKQERAAQLREKREAAKKAAERQAKKRAAEQRETTTPPEAPQGPKINPEDNERANSERAKNKLVVGGIAVGLLAFVVWGHRLRSKRHRKLKDRAKGK